MKYFEVYRKSIVLYSIPTFPAKKSEKIGEKLGFNFKIIFKNVNNKQTQAGFFVHTKIVAVVSAKS